MNKISITGVIAGAMLVLPVAAFAATNNTFITFPGSGANATLQAGDSVTAKATITLTAGSELESVSSQLVDSAGNDVGIPEKCVDVNDRATAGTFNVTFPLDTIGGTEGTWSVRIRTYGLNGPGVDNNCGAGSTDNQLYTNRLTLTEDTNSGTVANNTSSGSGSSTGASNPFASILATLTAMLAKLNAAPVTPPAPVTLPACTTLAAKMIGAQYGVRNQSNVMLQGYLLSEGESIPALAAGASFGLWLDQTNAALMHFKSVHGCQ